MIDDTVLDALVLALEDLAARGEPVNAVNVARAFGVPLDAVKNLQRAFVALEEPPPERRPERIDRYRIDGELGRGGMGVVYRAFDTVLERPVALKRMRADRMSPQRAERFRREIQALGRIQHPNVVMVLANGVDSDGRAFVVMQLVEGESLAARLRRAGPLPPPQAAALVLTLAETLTEVHAAGILHRDLKPSNVLITKGGEPVLTDFGLARVLDPAEWTRLSKTGQLLGSPGYWSPEQATGSPVGETADVYGLAAVLYACLTGVAPVRPSAAMAEAIAATISGNIVPPSELCPDLDPRLERICMQALEVDPVDRTPSAGAFAEHLRTWIPAEERERAPWYGLAGAALGLVVLIPLFAVAFPRAPAPSPAPPAAALETTVDPLAEAKAKQREHAHQDVLDLVEVVLEKDPRNGEAILMRAQANKHLGALAAAIADCTELIELEPENADAWALRAILYGLRMQNDKAFADASRALQIDPKHIPARLERAAAQAMSGDPRAAIADYGEVIVIDPNNVSARLRRGGAHFQLGEWAKAIVDCDAAIQVGNHAKAWEIRAQSRFELGDWEGAEDDATHSIKLHSYTCMMPVLCRGAARVKQGKWGAGIADLRLVIEKCLPGDGLIPRAELHLRVALQAQRKQAILDDLAR